MGPCSWEFRALFFTVLIVRPLYLIIGKTLHVYFAASPQDANVIFDCIPRVAPFALLRADPGLLSSGPYGTATCGGAKRSAPAVRQTLAIRSQ